MLNDGQEYIPWECNATIANKVDLPFVLSNDIERFWRDIIRYCGYRLDDAEFPELTALLASIESATGGAPNEPMVNIHSGMAYCLAYLAKFAYTFVRFQEGEKFYDSYAAKMLVEYLMQSVKQCIEENKSIRYTDEGIYIDMFQVPRWFYDEVRKVQERGW